MTGFGRNLLCLDEQTNPPGAPVPANCLWNSAADGLVLGSTVLDLRNKTIETRVTDTTTNIATAGVFTAEVMGAIADNPSGGDFVVNSATHEMTIVQAGSYHVYLGVDMHGGETTNAARNNIAFWYELNGAVVSKRFQNNYVRDASGHNETGQDGFQRLTVAAGDVLRVRRERVSGVGGTQTFGAINGAATTLSFLYVERKR